MKKTLILILASIMLVSMVSCKKTTQKTNKQDTEKTEQSQESGEIDYLSDLSDETFDGYEYRMLVRKTHLNDQYLAEDSDDIIESATFRRNKFVEEKYGIKISATESSDSNYDTSALNTILAGDDAYDLIFTHSRAAFVYAVQGAVENFNDIDSIHQDKPWWSKDIVNSCNINGNLYVINGDISSEPLGATMCMFFNKRIFDELGLEYPYQLVKDGDWTFDEFESLVKQGAKDLNGDGVMNPADDQYGFSCSEWEAPMNFLYTGGQRIYQKNDDGLLELSLYSNKTVDIYDLFFDLVDSEGCVLFSKTRGYEGSGMFKEGRCMISDGELRSAKSMRDMDDDFGILPYPKFDIDDEYATAVNGGTHLLCIPITVSDLERTGAITEALCAIGSRDIIPAFYELSLKSKYARDSESEEMIDLIRDSTVYDVGYVAGGTFQSCGYDLANSTSPNFSSYYARGESMALAKVDEFNKAYGEAE